MKLASKWAFLLIFLLSLSLVAQDDTEKPSVESQGQPDESDPEASGESEDTKEEKAEPKVFNLSNYSYALSRHISDMRSLGLDVVFIFDSTGSMGGAIQGAKDKIKEIDSILSAMVPDYRLGMYAYRDKGDAYVVKGSALTEYRQTPIRFLESVEAGGGGDWEEGVLEAFEEVFDNGGFRDKSFKIIFLIGDAPGHDHKKVMKLLKKKNRKLVPYSEEASKKYGAQLKPTYIVNTIHVTGGGMSGGGGLFGAAPKKDDDDKKTSDEEFAGSEEAPADKSEKPDKKGKDKDKDEKEEPVNSNANRVANEYREMAEATGGIYKNLSNADQVALPMLTLVFGKRFENEILTIVTDILEGNTVVPLGLDKYTPQQITDVILGDSNSASIVLNKMLDPRAPKIDPTAFEEAVLANKIKDTDRLTALIGLLGRLAEPSSYDALKKSLKHKELKVRMVALASLSELPLPAVRNVVVKEVSDDDLGELAVQLCARHQWLEGIKLAIRHHLRKGTSPSEGVRQSLLDLTGINFYTVNKKNIEQLKDWLEKQSDG